jgi:hypothetical protein
MSDFSIRPVGAPAPAPIVQAPSQAANDAVATDLPASQSVTVADPGAAARNDAQAQAQAASEFVSHQAFFDRDAASMVFQVLNGRTDAVVDQFPDEAVLRRRAYFHTLDMTKDNAPRVLPTDRTA